MTANNRIQRIKREMLQLMIIFTILLLGVAFLLVTNPGV